MQKKYESLGTLIRKHRILDTLKYKHLQAREVSPKYNNLILSLLSLEANLAKKIDGTSYYKGSEIIQGRRFVADWEFEQAKDGRILYFRKLKAPSDFPTKFDYTIYMLLS